MQSINLSSCCLQDIGIGFDRVHYFLFKWTIGRTSRRWYFRQHHRQFCHYFMWFRELVESEPFRYCRFRYVWVVLAPWKELNRSHHSILMISFFDLIFIIKVLGLVRSTNGLPRGQKKHASCLIESKKSLNLWSKLFRLLEKKFIF